ncbi:hypothetical protein [Amycolatopsis pittospori]|uniref:hypothetical protein n=1 Tax=Amycolatopsis pittospori TaxID=2749434 RepID=UPI0015F07DA4|nr:hypothetical protein [Amycolatopsis pittospori]
MFKKRALSLLALAATGATILFAAAPAASASQNAVAAACSAGYVEWDPDEGNGEGWSRCQPPYSVAYHRVFLLCYYDGDKVSPWVRPWEEARVTCTNGSGAYSAISMTR